MAKRRDIDRALEELPAGTEVTVVMKDGGEIVGMLQGADRDKIELAGKDADINLGSVHTILLSDSTESPE